MSEPGMLIEGDVIARLKAKYGTAEDGRGALVPLPARCAELEGGENLCEGGRHMKVEPMDTPTGPAERRLTMRRCPAAVRAEQRERLQPEIERLRPLLDRCGYSRITPEDRRPVSKILREAFESDRPVAGLDTLARVIDRYMARRPDRNLLLTAQPGQNNKGTGKTHAQLILYFAWLEQGVNVIFATSSRFRSLAKRRITGTEEQMFAAEQEVELIKRADVIVWSDIGDSRESSKGMETLVQDIAEEARGCFCLSMNHDRNSLADCPEIGHRAVDRFWGDYRGNAAIEIPLAGPSQRAHSLSRRDPRARAAGER